MGRAGAVVQVAGRGLLCFLRGSGEGQQESKVSQRTQGAAHGVPRRAHGHRGILSSREPTPSDPPHSPRLLRRHVGTVTWKQAQRPCGACSQADLSQLPCGAGRGAGGRAPVDAPVDFPAAPAEQQRAREHHEGAPNEERHHHHQQHVVVQDGVGLSLRGPALRVRAGGRGLWRPRPHPPHPHPTHGGAARGVVPRRGQGDRGGGGGGRGHGGRRLHSEARRRGLGGQGLLSSSSSVPPPAFPGARAGDHTGR